MSRYYEPLQWKDSEEILLTDVEAILKLKHVDYRAWCLSIWGRQIPSNNAY